VFVDDDAQWQIELVASDGRHLARLRGTRSARLRARPRAFQQPPRVRRLQRLRPVVAAMMVVLMSFNPAD
jgi:hypothetical protein